jgi:hypothetical protein
VVHRTRPVLFQASRLTLAPSKPPNQWIWGAKVLEVKRSERAADFSPSTSANIKNKWMYTSVLPHVFMACVETPLPFMCIVHIDIPPIPKHLNFFFLGGGNHFTRPHIFSSSSLKYCSPLFVSSCAHYLRTKGGFTLNDAAI